MYLTLIAVVLAYPLVVDAGDRIGLRIDHVEVTREFLNAIEIQTPFDARSFSLVWAQSVFVDDALLRSRQGNVFAHPKVTYQSGEIVRLDFSPKKNKHRKSQIWDAECGSKFTLTPTLASSDTVNIALRKCADDAQAFSATVSSGHAIAFVLEEKATQLRLLIVRPYIHLNEAEPLRL